MARISKRENKNIYQTARENMNLTREKASELLLAMQPERIERIENEKFIPRPEEVLEMADKYNEPAICNYYCSHQCKVGEKYVPEIRLSDLSQIVLKMLASLNSTQDKQKRLIEITSDGKIGNDELTDFITIQNDLEEISQAVEALQLWVEKMLKSGDIDKEEYNRIISGN